MKTFWRLLGFLRPYRKGVLVSFALAGVAMAAGVLMHRYSIARAEALARLRTMAEAEHRSLADTAERIVAAVEALAAQGRPDTPS